MQTQTPDTQLHVVAPRQSLLAQFADLWRFRELLWQLVKRDLTSKYKRSTLGFVWSLLNPVFLLVIYGVAFSILGQSFQNFPVWLLSGLLVWTLFATALSTGTVSVTANAYVIGKVRFPRAILPLAAVGSAFVNFLLQACAFALVLVVLRYPVDWSYLWLALVALPVLVLLAAAVALLLAVLNVYGRDTQHFVELAMLGWFWLTPIVYAYQLIASQLTSRGLPSGLALLNPITPVVISIQRGVYGKASIPGPNGTTTYLLPDASQWWYLRNLAIVAFAAAVLFVIALRIFDRSEGNFAEMV